MNKKLLAAIFLVCLVPLAAHAAWSLTTWVTSAGGALTVRDGAPQTSLNGMVFKSYTTSQPFTVTVNANTGYTINKVIYNGVTETPGQSSYTVQGPTAQSVQVSFAAQRLAVTAVADAGGTVTPTSLGTIYYGSKLTSVRKFTFTPELAVASVAGIAGVPAGATVSSALPAAAGTSVTVTLPSGFIFTENITLSGTFFSPPIAKTIASQTVLIGNPVTLDGSASTGAPSSYSWTQSSGPGFPATRVIADSTPGAQVTFTPTVTGVYTFTLTVTGGSSVSTKVTVTDGTPPPPVVYDNITGLARNQCIDCHSAYGANGPGIVSNVFGNWSSSGHKTKGVFCTQCHSTVLVGDHPGPLRKGSVSAATFDYNFASAGSGNFCVTCHSPAIVTDFALSKHSIRAGSAACGFCHVAGVHNPNVACIDCHKSDNTYGLNWPPTGLEFHSSFTGGANVCKACHTTHNPKVLSIKTSCP
ncbi:MAG: cytochrome c3 family protein [Desulfuromonadaceae bacterium]|nr:cytochrome c3 family protein [Desulfuromonadaceae bacterium]